MMVALAVGGRTGPVESSVVAAWSEVVNASRQRNVIWTTAELFFINFIWLHFNESRLFYYNLHLTMPRK
jgi:hypothetical protein